jgi:hypothetical protein
MGLPACARTTDGLHSSYQSRSGPILKGHCTTRVNFPVTSFVYAPPTISPACGGLALIGWRVMLRLKVLVASVPLIAGAVIAGASLFPNPHPCIAVDDASVEISDLPWHADLHVAFTDDPAAATVRVGLAENPETADFAVVDDAGEADQSACAANPATRLVTVSAYPGKDEPVIYLSHDGAADFPIYVRSKSFSERDAAALVVGAGSGHRTEHASL